MRGAARKSALLGLEEIALESLLAKSVLENGATDRPATLPTRAQSHPLKAVFVGGIWWKWSIKRESLHFGTVTAWVTLEKLLNLSGSQQVYNYRLKIKRDHICKAINTIFLHMQTELLLILVLVTVVLEFK